MDTPAVVFEEPERLSLQVLALDAPGPADVVVEVDYSGISTGTERLLYTGKMPAFPGMGYPLVPGYESVGRVSWAGEDTERRLGETVFVPGASCFGAVRGLFGGTAARLVVPAGRVVALDADLGAQGVLLALAATAHHAVAAGPLPELVVGHGVLGRLIARACLALGGDAPTVWERDPRRASGATGYSVIDPADDDRHDYRVVCDVSGDGDLLDALIARLAPRGELVLAGFYGPRLDFAFPPAFIKEARLRIAAEWQRDDLDAVTGLLAAGRLSLAELITHREAAERAERAYGTAFFDIDCLKMILDWSNCR